MRLFSWLFGKDNSEDIVTKKGRVYKRVDEKEIPNWAWTQHVSKVKRGEITTSHKGKKYRYIIGPHDCWKRKRGKK